VPARQLETWRGVCVRASEHQPNKPEKSGSNSSVNYQTECEEENLVVVLRVALQQAHE
jgi:hypothetical protein